MKLFVGNISYTLQEEELKEKFDQFGTVQSCRIIHDRETGRSRGFGFVEMSSREESEAAIAGLHGQDFGGRSIVVNEARQDSRGPRRDFSHQ